MKEIPLTQGKVALIDDEDFGAVSKFSWQLHRAACGKLYAQRSAGSRPNQWQETLHAFLMCPPDGLQVDHRNSDGLDCQRHNMRLATALENGANKQKTKKPTSSQYKGVSYHKQTGKWASSIAPRGGRHFLGLFEEEIDAAKAYDVAAVRFFGEFARLNFPDIVSGENNPRKQIENEC